MFGHTFYHKTIRKYVSLFGTLFNEIYINRTDASGKQVQTLKIPVTYGPKNKALTRLDSDPYLNRPSQITLPNISFEIVSMNYSPDRKLSTIRKHDIVVSKSDAGEWKYIYNPVPYDIDFNLYVACKNAEDGTRILEQILPFFTPDWTTTVNVISDTNTILDIPVVIKSVNCDDTYEGPAEETRRIVWTLSFTLKGYLFGPVRKTDAIIKSANINFFDTITTTVPDVSEWDGLKVEIKV